MTIAELQAKYSAELKAAKGINDLCAKENRDMSAEELSTFSAHMDKADGYKAQMAQLKRLDAGLSESAGRVVPVDAGMPLATTTSTTNTSHIQTLDLVTVDPTRGYGAHGLGTFAADVHTFNGTHRLPKGLQPMAAAGDGLSAGITADGGVLLPPAFSSEIQDRMGVASNSLLAETDQLPPLPYGVESMEYPVVNETSRADGSRAGGVRGYWKAELTQMTESKPAFKAIKFSPSELYVFVYVADKLLKNAASISSFISSRCADELNFKIGDAIINGTGTAQPRGVLAGATDQPRVQIAKETGQAAATVVVANLEKMFARLPGRYVNGAKWYINQDVWPALFSMTKAVGTGGLPVFLPGGNVAGAPFGTIYGLPIVPLEYCATLGTEGDIILANFKAYGTQTRGGVESAMSMHLKFDYNQSCFRFITEVDGQPWLSSSITPFKGTAKQSAFVTLANRA